MYKLNLDQKIVGIDGKPIKNGKEDVTMRSILMGLLSSSFKKESVKEAFWAHEIGILSSDEKKKEIELSNDKIQFIRRIVKDNDFSTDNRPMPLYTPFMQAAILIALGLTEKDF